MGLAHSFNVSIAAPGGVVFEGKAQRVIFPGKNGTFEILVNHKPLLSRLRSGTIVVDNEEIPIAQGAVRVLSNQVLAIVERRKSGRH
jgi:F-type H+-transporting ATPase subunit epsilon